MPEGGLLGIYAHPDDETFGIGGTMARYAAQGTPVTMVCATRGEVGEIAPGTGATPETLGQYREQELRDACAILGVSDVRFLEFRDSGMAGTPENDDPRSLYRADPEHVVAALVRVIRDVRPAVISTWDASGGYGHPDHIAVHLHATTAYHAAADPARYPELGRPHRADSLFYNVIPIDEFRSLAQELEKRGISMGEAPGGDENLATLPRLTPNCVVDVSGFYDLKRRALRAHGTQISDGDVFVNLPEDLGRRFFGREYFFRADPTLADGVVLSDLLAGAG
ncbi:MAG TPA: PIG-L family deacetylase [Dehalococcoidia bacterium]|nr:PIG-L family deacetylase [Dehalococcoidia bacterium]